MKLNKKAIAAALVSVSHNAFQQGVSRNATVAAFGAAMGRKPTLALYNSGRDALVSGLMAAALARKGDNRPEGVLVPHCLDRINPKLFGAFGGKGTLSKGQKGRRTKDEEAAYLSARVQVSAIARDASVTVPTKSGTGQKGTAKGAKGANAKRNSTAKGAKAEKPVTPKVRDADSLIEYVHLQAKAMQSTFQRAMRQSAIKADPRVSEVGELLQLFVSKATNIH